MHFIIIANLLHVSCIYSQTREDELLFLEIKILFEEYFIRDILLDIDHHDIHRNYDGNTLLENCMILFNITYYKLNGLT